MVALRATLLCVLCSSACRRAQPAPSRVRPAVVIAARDAAPVDAPVDAARPAAGCRVDPPAPGRVLAPRSDELTVVALGDRAMVVDNWHAHEDPSRCERHPEECVGDYAAHENNPYTQAWIVGEQLSHPPRELVPASTAHDLSSSAAGPSSHADFAAGLVRNRRFETMVFGTEYLADGSFVTLGLDDGSRVARTRLNPESSDGDYAPELREGSSAAAGNDAVAMGVIFLNLGQTDPEAEAPARGVLMAYAHEGGRFRTEALARFEGRERAEVPDIALRSDGGAVVFRAGDQLRGVRLDGHGRRVGAAVTISRERPGAPTIAWDGDALVVVWARRASRGQPFRLQRVRWNPVTNDLSAPTEIATGAGSAFAPSLDVRDGHHALAWMEGDDHTGVVRAGVSTVSLDDAARRAVTVSSEGVNARDPELALGDRVAWVAWHELVAPLPPSRAAPDGVVHVTTLRCDAP